MHARFAFETEMAIDRYLEVNRESSERARVAVEEIRRERAATEAALAQLSRFPHTPRWSDMTSKEDVGLQQASVSVPDTVSAGTAAATVDMACVMRKEDVMTTGGGVAAVEEKASAHGFGQSPKVAVNPVDDMSSVYARARLRVEAAVSSAASEGRESLIVPGISAEDRDTLVELLDKIANHDRSQVDSYRNKLTALAENEVAAYADMDRTMYSLHAVLVHDGESSSGHYWAYIRNKNSSSEGDRWLKFSDLMVSYVSESEMLSLSLGGTGFASAYFLIYVRNFGGKKVSSAVGSAGISSGESMEIDTVGASGHSTDFGGIMQEGRGLLPKARLDEVEAWNSAFDEELERYVAQKTAESRVQLARTIVEAAVGSIRGATETLRGLRLAEASTLSGVVDIVPNRTSGTRSLIEFCVAIEARASALTHALCCAWTVFMSDADEGERELLAFVAGRNHVLAAYPPLSGSPDSGEGPVGSDAPDGHSATLLVNEINRLLRDFSTEFPSDVSHVTKESLLSLSDALSGSQELSRIQEAAGTLEIFYSFALRAQCLAKAAFSAALRGLLGECLGFFVILLRQDISLYLDSDVSKAANADLASKFASAAQTSLGRRDEEALRFLPSILRAVLLRLSKIDHLFAAGSASQQHAGERSALAVHLRDLTGILKNRASGKRGTAAMVGNTKLSVVSEDHALKVTSECLKLLESTDLSQDTVDVERARAKATMSICTQEAVTAIARKEILEVASSYERLRDQLCAIGCDAIDEASAANAGHALLLSSVEKTAAA